MKKSQKNHGKLTLQKLQIATLNNLNSIWGGNGQKAFLDEADEDGSIPTWTTLRG